MQTAETRTAGTSKKIFPLITAKKLGTAPRRSAAVVAGIVFGAVKLIQYAIRKNKNKGE